MSETVTVRIDIVPELRRAANAAPLLAHFFEGAARVIEVLRDLRTEKDAEIARLREEVKRLEERLEAETDWRSDRTDCN